MAEQVVGDDLLERRGDPHRPLRLRRRLPHGRQRQLQPRLRVEGAAALYKDGRGRSFVGVWLAGYGRHLAFEPMTGADTWKVPATVALEGSWVRHDTPCPGEKVLQPETVAPTSGCGSPRVGFEVALDGSNGGRLGSHRFPVGGAVLYPRQVFPTCPSVRTVGDELGLYPLLDCARRPGFSRGAMDEAGTLASSLHYQPKRLLKPTRTTYTLRGSQKFSCSLEEDSTGDETLGHDELEFTGTCAYTLTLRLRRGHS